MSVATLPWQQRFRANRRPCDSTFDSGNLISVNGTVSDFIATGKATTVDMLPQYGILDNLCGMHDWFRTAATTAAEISFDYFDFESDNELRCGWHKTIRSCAAKGMMLCERVPPNINVAMALFATRMRISVGAILATYFRSWRCFVQTLGDLRCLVGTRGENIDSSVDNLHETDWYEDTSS